MGQTPGFRVSLDVSLGRPPGSEFWKAWNNFSLAKPSIVKARPWLTVDG